MIDIALSIRQPWAWLIVNGHKDVENRTWKTGVRGRIAIHAGKAFDKDAFDWIRYNFPEIDMPMQGAIPRGGIVGFATITDCVDNMDSPWFFGEYGFVMTDGVPCKLVHLPGQLGFFHVEIHEANVALLEGRP